MRRTPRPFVVEVKGRNKRPPASISFGSAKRPSIRGTLSNTGPIDPDEQPDVVFPDFEEYHPAPDHPPVKSIFDDLPYEPTPDAARAAAEALFAPRNRQPSTPSASAPPKTAAPAAIPVKPARPAPRIEPRIEKPAAPPPAPVQQQQPEDTPVMPRPGGRILMSTAALPDPMAEHMRKLAADRAQKRKETIARQAPHIGGPKRRGRPPRLQTRPVVEKAQISLPMDLPPTPRPAARRVAKPTLVTIPKPVVQPVAAPVQQPVQMVSRQLGLRSRRGVTNVMERYVWKTDTTGWRNWKKQRRAK